MRHEDEVAVGEIESAREPSEESRRNRADGADYQHHFSRAPQVGTAAPQAVEFDGESAREAERFTMGQRIREVEQGPDGAIWLLEDGGNSGGRLLKLTPAAATGG